MALFLKLECGNFLYSFLYPPQEVGPDGFVSELREGLMCCALYKEEGKWYRVQVTKVINANRVSCRGSVGHEFA